MANEVNVTARMEITSGVNKYRMSRDNFISSLVGTYNGPTPGAISVSVAGTDVSLAQLTTPGFCVITNLDLTNFVSVGTWGDSEFIPLIEVGPGEFAMFKLSRNLGKSYGVGTGTTDSGATLRLKADTAACKVLVEAFER